jgi:hypothetical protein
VLEEVARIFRDEPEKIETNRSLLMEALSERRPRSGQQPDRALLDQAAERLLGFIDHERGGVRGAPKFPQASLLEMLWRAGLRTADTRYANAVLVTLRNIAQGGIYDHLGGGFARYSVDDRWLVPHFEKMLYDNAQLDLMTYAYLGIREPLFRLRIEETIAFLVREMQLPERCLRGEPRCRFRGPRAVSMSSRPRPRAGTPDAAFARIYDITRRN